MTLVAEIVEAVPQSQVGWPGALFGIVAVIVGGWVITSFFKHIERL